MRITYTKAIKESGTTIGSELSASQGSAGHIYFYYNMKLTSSGWEYRTTGGTNTSTDPPPHGNWVVTPCDNCDNGYASYGGEYQTYD